MIEKLGYNKIAHNIAKTHGVWNHNFNVIFTTQDTELLAPGITGLGFVCDPATVHQLGAKLDDSTDLHITHDPNGMKIMLCVVDSTNTILGKKYIKRADPPAANPMLLKYTSSVVYNGYSDEIADFYKTLGFRITNAGDDYVAMVCDTNRFTIMFKRESEDTGVTAIMCETDDVFYTTSYYVKEGLPLKPYNQPVEDFGSLTYKINGYDCLADGNAASYTIENCVKQALPNVDLIFRTRKQYIHLHEDTLKKHIS